MSNTQSLEDILKQAQDSLKKAEADLAIKNHIIQQLTNDDGSIINTEIHFELGEMKVSIGKKRSYNRSADEAVKGKKVRGKKEKRVHRSKAEKELIFTECLKASFKDKKKEDAIAAFAEVSPKFTANLWNDFQKSKYAKSLTKQGETRNMTYSFGEQVEAKATAKAAKATKAASTKAPAKKRAAKKKAK
jgi:hypothetical protein